jgi:hypothetical protein
MLEPRVSSIATPWAASELVMNRGDRPIRQGRRAMPRCNVACPGLQARENS